MLAKVWKKVLFAICIIACIYNVMHKLISRTSLETQLESVKNQGSIIEMLDSNSSTNQVIKDSSKENKTTNVVNQEMEKDENTIVVVY